MKKSHLRRSTSAISAKLFDEIQDRCRTIAALSDFLAKSDPEQLDKATIHQTGLIIFRETEKLQNLHTRLQNQRRGGVF